MKFFYPFFVFFLLLLSSALAVDLNENLYSAWPLDDPNSTNSLFNLTCNGVCDYGTGINGDAFHVNLSGYLYNTNALLAMNHGVSAYCISFWTKVFDPTLNNAGFIGKYGGGGYILYTDSASQVYQMLNNDGTDDLALSTIGISLDVWQHVAMGYSDLENVMMIYINGTNVKNGSSSTISPSAASFNIGTWSDQDIRRINGSIDEVYIYNVSCNNDMVGDLYNNGTGFFYPFTPPPPASVVEINWSFPVANNSYHTLALDINFSVSSNNFTINCSVYQNDSPVLNLSGIAFNSTYNLTVNFSNVTEAYYEYFINCTNLDNTSDQTEVRGVWIDTREPIITSSFDDNMSFAIVFLDGHINVSDPNLFNFNVSIDNVLVDNLSNLPAGTLMFNISFNASLLAHGLHNISFCASDGHTTKKLNKDWFLWKDDSDKSLNYFVGDGYVSIRPKNKNLFKSHGSVRSLDRFSWSYDLVDTSFKKDLVFIVESDMDISIPVKTGFEGWLIIESLGVWVDFESLKGYDTSIERINKKRLEVTVIGVNYDLVFNSVGELNSNCQTKLWDKINLTDNSDSTGLENENASFVLITNFSNTYQASIDLVFGETVYATSRIGNVFNVTFSLPIGFNDTETVNYFWNYSFTNSTTITNQTDNESFTYYMIVIASCTNPLYNSSAMSFFFFDEENISSSVFGAMQGLVSVWKSYPSRQRNYTLSLTTEAASQSICIWPGGEQFTVLGELDYYNSTSTTKRYFLNGSLNITNFRNETLYLIGNASIGRVYLTVLDKRGFPFPDVRVTLERWDADTSVFFVVETFNTDFQGTSSFLAVLYDPEYRFIFEWPVGTVVDITPKASIDRLTLEHQLLIGDSILEDFFLSFDVSGTATFDNNTNIFQFKFNDPHQLIDQGCLVVRRFSLTSGSTIVNSSCIVGTSGIINLSVPGIVGRSYIGSGTVIFNNEETLLNQVSGTVIASIAPFGSGISWWLLLFTVVVIFVFGRNPALMLVALPLPLDMFVILNLIKINFSVALSATILCWIFAAIVHRRQAQ